MGPLFRSAAAALGILVLAPQHLAAQQPAPPLVRTEGLRKISAHVHVIPDNSVPLVPNVGFIVGEKAVLVVDTGLGPPNGAAVLAVAQQLAGARDLYLVSTHFHPEHDLGAQAFPSTTKLIRSQDEIRDIAEFGLQLAKVFATRSPLHAELLKDADYRKADITFDQSYDLDLGGVTAHFMALGANHTRGDTAVWIEADRVLFAGDVAMKLQPAFASPYSSMRHWFASLDQLEALKPALIVPAHGPMGDAGIIQGYRAYMTDVRDRATAEKKAGQTADQAVAVVTAALADRFPDRMRLEQAIRVAYAEAP